MRIKILAGIYVLVLAVIIFLASRSDTQHLFRFIRDLPLGDKIGHLLLMGFLSFLFNLALSGRRIRIWRANLPLGTLIVLLVVTIEEFSQIFVRVRTFDFGDLAFDFVGILIFGQLACWLASREEVKS